MKNYKKKPKMDAKFNTKLHDYGRKAHTMTAKQRKEFRKGQEIALSMTPIGNTARALSTAAKLAKAATKTTKALKAASRARNVTANPFKEQKIIRQFIKDTGTKIPSKKSPVRNLNIKAERNPLVEYNPLRKPGTKGFSNPPKDVSKFLFPRMKRPEAPLQNGKELKPIMIKPNMGKMIKPMAKFPDLSGDGKVTQKDILIGKGVIDKPKYGKKPKMYNKPKMDHGKKPKMYNKPKYYGKKKK